MEFIYKNEDYLTGFTLDTKLFDMANIEALDVEPVRDYFIITGRDAKFRVEKFLGSQEKLKEIDFIVRELKEKGIKIADIIRSKEESISVEFCEDSYIFSELPEGEEIDFRNIEDCIEGIKALAQIHREGASIAKAYGSFEDKLKMKERLKEEMYRGRKELSFCKKIADAHEIKTGFDEILLRVFSFYKRSIDLTINYINNMEGKFEKDRITVSHKYISGHNIIKGESGIIIADPAKFTFDFPHRDIASYIMCVLRKNEWDFNTAVKALEAYSSVRKLNRKDMELILIYLMYPAELIALASSYCRRKVILEDSFFESRILRASAHRERRKRFFRLLRAYITKEAA